MSKRFRHKVLKFLNEIGIPTVIVPEVNGFVPRVRIVDGGIVCQGDCYIGDILHEAGHIAITPSKWRPLLNGDIKYAHKQMLSDIGEMDLHPDDPLFRAAIQAGDQEATAWAWAAGQHLKLPSAYIINANDPQAYEGEAWTTLMRLSGNQHSGINGLSHGGFCCPRIALGDKPVYPKLKYWLQI